MQLRIVISHFEGQPTYHSAKQDVRNHSNGKTRQRALYATGNERSDEKSHLGKEAQCTVPTCAVTDRYRTRLFMSGQRILLRGGKSFPVIFMFAAVPHIGEEGGGEIEQVQKQMSCFFNQALTLK